MKIAADKILKFCLICGLTILFSACPQPRGKPAIQPATSQRIYPLPYDRVWDAALAVVTEDLKYPLEIVERDTGMIATQWVMFEKKPGNYRESELTTVITPTKPIFVQYRVMVMVKITPEGTMVRVRRYSEEWIERWTPVASDLQFERQFLLLVDKRLGMNP